MGLEAKINQQFIECSNRDFMDNTIRDHRMLSDQKMIYTHSSNNES